MTASQFLSELDTLRAYCGEYVGRGQLEEWPIRCDPHTALLSREPSEADVQRGAS